MKNIITKICGTGLLLTTIMALYMSQSTVSAKPPHGGGSGGGSFYPTVSTVSQLIADINYANTVGGAITINLAPGVTFDLTSANNTIDGGNGLPVIGGATAVSLTIMGNGDTIERLAVTSKFGTVKNPFRLFEVSAGSWLTLDHVTLKDGMPVGSGGAILNHGRLNVIDGCTLSGNGANSVYNAGGTVTVSNSTLSDNDGGVYNTGGTVTVSNSTLSGDGAAVYNAMGTVTVSTSTLSENDEGAIVNGNGSVTISDGTLSHNQTMEDGGAVFNNSGTVAINNCTLNANSARYGGAIYNSAGTVTMSNSSISGNSAWHSDYPWSTGDGGGIYNAGGTLTISGSTLSGNSADQYFGSGGGILNTGTATVENDSSITGNSASAGGDVENYGVLYLDNTSTIGSLDGNFIILN